MEAVGSAVAVQRAMAERNADIPVDQRIEFRIGVHQGDIVVDDQDIFGDGVNVAARLETLSAPGGICISGRVYEDMSGRLELPFEDRGEQQLKNIARPVRIYALGTETIAGLPATPALASEDPSNNGFARLSCNSNNAANPKRYSSPSLLRNGVCSIRSIVGIRFSLSTRNDGASTGP